jgi:hypothetical protein
VQLGEEFGLDLGARILDEETVAELVDLQLTTEPVLELGAGYTTIQRGVYMAV